MGILRKLRHHHEALPRLSCCFHHLRHLRQVDMRGLHCRGQLHVCLPHLRGVPGKQVDILLADVCPQVEASEECVEGLPDFWKRVAMVLWPGYYNADAEWMCAPLCKVREITCEECFQGLQKGVEQLLQEETIMAIVEALSGDAFCAQSEDAERCAA